MIFSLLSSPPTPPLLHPPLPSLPPLPPLPPPLSSLPPHLTASPPSPAPSALPHPPLLSLILLLSARFGLDFFSFECSSFFSLPFGLAVWLLFCLSHCLYHYLPRTSESLNLLLRVSNPHELSSLIISLLSLSFCLLPFFLQLLIRYS